MRSTVRERNIGWRLDYVFEEETLRGDLVACRHLPEITGSDHCPVEVEMNVPALAGVVEVVRRPEFRRGANLAADAGLPVRGPGDRDRGPRPAREKVRHHLIGLGA
ncbi:hypothetical protein [Methylorubrum thiocyanatum]|uniref:hypothetical protein n=1 Tax=Methylorubrum thiocyanatum TaxID=47958 RepID=UPI0035C80025